jgi:glutaredoxin
MLNAPVVPLAFRYFPLMALVFLRSSSSRAFNVPKPTFARLVSITCLGRRFASVTGSQYEGGEAYPKVTLFTKEGCTLCDKVKDILKGLREEAPHSLEQIDITDDQYSQWFVRYKYDIPVLHINGKYWLKHRTDEKEALAGLLEAYKGDFEARPGEPNAEALERKVKKNS